MSLKDIFKKKYFDKNMKCPNCHQVNKPIIKKNSLGNPTAIWGQADVDTYKNYKRYLLVCPNCNYIMSSIGRK
jgi:ssDNA-binding Zn-finger/Zn-ribbon topoisomerase 1